MRATQKHEKGQLQARSMKDEWTNVRRGRHSHPFQGGVGVVSKVAQPPYGCCESSAFQGGALRDHRQGRFASFITTPFPSLKRSGVSANFQFIHTFYDRAPCVDSR